MESRAVRSPICAAAVLGAQNALVTDSQYHVERVVHAASDQWNKGIELKMEEKNKILILHINNSQQNNIKRSYVVRFFLGQLGFPRDKDVSFPEFVETDFPKALFVNTGSRYGRGPQGELTAYLAKVFTIMWGSFDRFLRRFRLSQATLAVSETLLHNSPLTLMSC